MGKQGIIKYWGEYRSTFLFLVLMVVFRSSVADWNEVPTGSMKPTIVEGDRIWVNKLAYDVKLPLANISIYQIGLPKRGEIIVFNSNNADKRLIKRVIGLPDDIVSMKNNQLYINDKLLKYDLVDKSTQLLRFNENLLGVNHLMQVNSQSPSPRSSFTPVKVPENQYLVLGDNRDNSADSRYIGFVPRDEIIGRATSVVISLNYEKYYLPRAERFLIDL